MHFKTGMNTKEFTPQDEEILRENMKRCSPETVEAAIAFRRTGDVSKINAIVLGILERFADPSMRGKLKDPSDDMVLAQELGLDSLTMMEVVLMVEDSIGISIDTEEAMKLKTFGDIKNYINKKAAQ